jgi:hypothetical protein
VCLSRVARSERKFPPIGRFSQRGPRRKVVARGGAEAALCKTLPQDCETTAADAVAAAPKLELIHSGVMRYFREIGVVKQA